VAHDPQTAVLLRLRLIEQRDRHAAVGIEQRTDGYVLADRG